MSSTSNQPAPAMSVSPRERETAGRAWTPGPLTYDVCTGDIVMDDELGARVATIDLDNCADKDQAHADGRLFAAAPELFEALLRAREVVNAVCLSTHSVSFDADLRAIDAALSRAVEVEHG